jgi:hypothetical protein
MGCCCIIGGCCCIPYGCACVFTMGDCGCELVMLMTGCAAATGFCAWWTMTVVGAAIGAS